MTITAQLDLAFPDVPGFKGQGWSTQETAMAVRWLFSDPAAWARAMAVARHYPQNPHAVADTLHEQIVPRSELEAIARDGGDPAKVNWLEIGHELIERRDDPLPAQEHAGITAQALTLTGDGHGHHVPGTPDVYRHGWEPIAGSETGAGGTAGKALHGDAAYGHVAEVSGKRERDAADYYSVGSGRLNPPLRNGTKMTDKTDAAQLRNLESAFAKAPPTTRHIVAYRGTIGSLFGEENATGTQFTDKGFTSISTDHKQAAMFGPEKGSALMEIHIPAGSKVVKPGAAGHYSEGDDAEKELVLNHGGQFEITSDQTVNDPELGQIRKLTATYKGPA